MTRLKAEKYATAKYDVLTLPPYPRRVGHIVGGNGTYLAEIGQESLGYFKTLQGALSAIHSALASPKHKGEKS
jgi:hypothetical protein